MNRTGGRGDGTVYGVMGWPVGHSLSPVMHGAALEAMGLEGHYGKFAVAPEGLKNAVSGAWALGVRGMNVTIPHKRTVMEHVDQLTPEAVRMGAVNTLVRGEAGWIGANTDGEGFVRGLREAGVDPKGQSILLVGAGGAARAIAFALRHAGARRLVVAARRAESAQGLAQALLNPRKNVLDASEKAKSTEKSTVFENVLDALGGQMGSRFWEGVGAFDGLVQATGATMADGTDPMATEAAVRFAESLPLELVRPGGWVGDIVYQPLRTAVLSRAGALGLTTVDGTAMLVHQGAMALELWTGKTAPVEVMRSALLRALRTGDAPGG